MYLCDTKKVPFTVQPLGLTRLDLKILSYMSMFWPVTAPLKLIMIIWGTCGPISGECGEVT